MKLSEELLWRGLVKDKTFSDLKWLDQPKTFYLGIDCSADSLTIGNLAVLFLAKRLLHAGWKTVLLVGGATSLIGDPGGKHEERELKSREEITANVSSIREQVKRLFGGEGFKLVDNYDWFKNIGFLDFLRDVGKHYSMTELVQRDFIAERMGEDSTGISYAEFSYTLIQGYDYWHLYKQQNVVLQIGGSDQWGNMLSGVPLIRKKEGQEVHALSMPLIIDESTGRKFGKSEEGAVWLDPLKTSPTQFYQFWINIDDKGVEYYLKVYTELGPEDIAGVLSEHNAHPEQRLAQIKLAREVTSLVHGKDNMAIAEAVTEVITGKRDLLDLNRAVVEELRRELPKAKVEANGSIVEVLVSTGLAHSNSDARRLLEAGAVYINNKPTTKTNFENSDFRQGKVILRRGKAYKDSSLIELS